MKEQIINDCIRLISDLQVNKDNEMYLFYDYVKYFLENEVINIKSIHFKEDDRSIKYMGEALVKNTLKELRFYSCEIGQTNCKTLANFMKKNKSLQVLEFLNCNLGDLGGSFLVDSLLYNNSLKILSVPKCFKDSCDGTSLNNYIKKVTSLKFLDLAYNELGNNIELCRSISQGLEKNSSIESINLRCNELVYNGMSSILRFVCFNNRITYIDLSKNGISTKACQVIFDCFINNRSVETLILNDNNELTNEGARHMALLLEVNSSIKHFEIRSCNLGDVSMKYFGRMIKLNKSLTKLDLGNNSISSIGAFNIFKGLECNTHLKSLDLGFNHVNRNMDELFSYLKKNVTLECLNLSSNYFEESSWGQMGTLLKFSKSIRNLDLSFNKLESLMSPLDFIFHSLIDMNCVVEFINLSNLKLSNEDTSKLSKVIAENNVMKIINLSSNNIEDNQFADLIGGLCRNKTLQYLDLSNNKITDASFDQLVKLLSSTCELESMNLTMNRLTHDCSTRIQELTENLNFNKIIIQS